METSIQDTSPTDCLKGSDSTSGQITRSTEETSSKDTETGMDSGMTTSRSKATKDTTCLIENTGTESITGTTDTSIKEILSRI